MGFNVFEPFNRLFGLLMKSMSILYLFGTVNINKVVSTDKNVLLPCINHISNLLLKVL